MGAVPVQQHQILVKLSAFQKAIVIAQSAGGSNLRRILLNSNAEREACSSVNIF
jgi:hypothetical protein